MPKINCPLHDDKTASMEIYPDGWAHCFGCGGRMPANRLNSQYRIADYTEKYVENLDETLTYIEGLPKAEVRGLQFPIDSLSYYIVWPDRSYYNRRFFDVTDERGKYKCPAGHERKLFWARRDEESDVLLVVEGEINALSVSQVVWHGINVCSPGAAVNFYSKAADKNLPIYAAYDKIVLLVDSDRAGAMAAIQLKANLAGLGHKNVVIRLMDKDANDILVQNGTEELKKTIKKAMEMP